MLQVDKLSIVEDIEIEYKKCYNECKKKHNEVKLGLDEGLNILEHLKTLNMNQLEQELKQSVDTLLSPLILASHKPIKKLYVSSLIIIKKLVSYGLIKQKQSNEIIEILKDILSNSNEEFVQIKVIETLVTMVDPSIIQLSQTLVSKIMTMCLKFFSFKSGVFKNPLGALLKQLMKTVFRFLYDSLQPVVDKAVKNKKKIITSTVEKGKEENIKVEGKDKEIEGKEEGGDEKNEEEKEEEKEEEEENKEEEKEEGMEEEKEDDRNEENQEEKEENQLDGTSQENDTSKNDELKEIIVNNTTEPLKNTITTPQELSSDIIDLSEYEDMDFYKSAYDIFTQICDLCEGKRNPIIYTTIYSKCLGYELLASILSITKKLFLYMPSFFSRITNNIIPTLSKAFSSNSDYITCVKICRLTIQILQNLLIGQDLIKFFIKYAESTSINWQKQIGIESISTIFTCKELIYELYKNEVIYTELFNTMAKISYASALNKKGLNETELKTYKTILQNKIIDNENIFTDGEMIPNCSHSIIYIVILQVYLSIKKTYLQIMSQNNINLNSKLNDEMTDKEKEMRMIIEFKHENFIGALLALVQSTNNEDIIEEFMDLFIDFVNIFSALNIMNIRDIYLKEINNLILNDSNSILSDKTMNTIFRFFNNVNVLDRNAFVILIDSLQKIYIKIVNSELNLMINPKEEFELDVYIRYIEERIQKYSNMEMESILIVTQSQKEDDEEKEEEKEETKEDKEKEEDDEYENGGIFSKLKYALGFSKKKSNDEPHSINPIKSKETLKSITDKINSLFLSQSLSFSDDIITELITALKDSSITICDTPSENQITCLHFNLFKFIELCIVNYKRIDLIWDTFLSTSTQIASRQIKKASHFSIDILTMTVMFLLFLINKIPKEEFNVIFTSSKDDDYSYQNWQRKIISSLSFISAKNISQDINLNIIYDLSILIFNISNELNTEGWNCIVEIFKTQIASKEEAQSENCFMLLEQIFHVNYNILTPGNILPLVDLLDIFIQYKKNENIAISSLKLIIQIANLCEKFNQYIYIEDLVKNSEFNSKLTKFQLDFYLFYNDTIEKRKNYADDIWRGIFIKMINLSCDERGSIRKSVIETYKDIYIKKSSLISPETAMIIIKDNFFELIDKAYGIYEEKIKNNRKFVLSLVTQNTKEISNSVHFKPISSNELNESSDSSELNFKFGEFQVGNFKLPEKKKTLRYEEDKISKPSEDEILWENTLYESISSLSFVISSFLETNTNLGKEFYKENIYTLLSEKLSNIMKYTSPKIICEILKCLLNISLANSELYYKNIEMFWDIYDEMSQFIQHDNFSKLFPKNSSECEMVSTILSNLKEMFLNKNSIQINSNILSGDNLTHLINLLKSLIISSYNSEGRSIFEFPYKLLYDEANVFDFCIEMQKIITTNEESLIKYAHFLSSYLQLNLNELHSEALCRKSLEMFVIFFTNEKLSLNIVLNYLPLFIEQTRDIICLKNKSEYITVFLRDNYKTELPIWHFASDVLIKILKFVISTNNKLKTNINSIWKCLISAYENLFKQNEKGFKIPNKSQMDEMIKSLQEMEISIINFIVNSLLPNSLHIPKEMQIKLLNLLDMGSNFDYNSTNVSTSVNAITSSISKVCISNLFEICKFKTEESLRREVIDFNMEEYIQIKVKIAKMCTPILIKRCKETLKKFLDDEIKSGSMPLSRARLEDIKFVLEKLKNLEVYPNYNLLDKGDNNTPKEIMDFILMKKKSHLISLLPLLSEFITTKEHEIKIIVKDIFTIISDEIGVK